MRSFWKIWENKMPRKPSGDFDKSRYINGFIKEKYDRINLLVPSGKKAIIAARAAEKKQSINAYINALIDADIKNK